MPAENAVLKKNSLEYEVELSPNFSTQKDEMLDFPVGYVFYKKENKQLVSSDFYHNHIHKSN